MPNQASIVRPGDLGSQDTHWVLYNLGLIPVTLPAITSEIEDGSELFDDRMWRSVRHSFKAGEAGS